MSTTAIVILCLLCLVVGMIWGMAINHWMCLRREKEYDDHVRESLKAYDYDMLPAFLRRQAD